jgi:hypothetical protein
MKKKLGLTGLIITAKVNYSWFDEAQKKPLQDMLQGPGRRELY